MLKILASIVLSIVFLSCQNQKKDSTASFSFSITNLSDEEYPDNPDIGFRASNYEHELLDSGHLKINDTTNLMGQLFFTNSSGDSLKFNHLNFSEFIPTIPEYIRHHDYLSYISCVNQEWNRNQVQFSLNEFETNLQNISRVDIARNCLNAYLWEVILYTHKDGEELPYAHGWFDFPAKPYKKWFEIKNGVEFEVYSAALENWVDPKSQKINLNELRHFEAEVVVVSFADLSDNMYPLKKARKKKLKEVIYPKLFKTMSDLQTDSTLFATFSQPGFYNKKDARSTELGRLKSLKYIQVLATKNKLDSSVTHEVGLTFKDSFGRTTHLIFGGLNLNDFPVLDIKDANNGWKNSMGIGNHTFYENSKAHNSLKAATNTYYALILDDEYKWLDSHKIGIDGPIFHFSDEERKTLNIWLLSFERHALVGHYQVVFN